MQRLYKSIHAHELFMPLWNNERMMMDVIERLAEQGNYHAVEIAPYMEKESHRRMNEIQKRHGLSNMMWAAPLIWDESLDLSSVDASLREKSIARTLMILDSAIEMGTTYIGLPPGDDPGPGLREEAKKLFLDSCARIAEVAKRYGISIVIEFLDRYVHKKKVLGPMKEGVEWFRELRKCCSNAYIHWDSAHEALAGIDLLESLHLARPYLAQLHLCNCITDPANPMYGDWHMDVGQPPDFETDGYLSVDVGAQILREVASFDPPEGVPFTHVSIEMRSHMGDDLWNKEKTARLYLDRCFEVAGV